MRDLDALQRDTGVAGEVDVLVEARDLTDPKVIAWMRDYQTDILIRHGYDPAKGCAGAELCPALSLPDLFRTPELSATREQIRALWTPSPPTSRRPRSRPTGGPPCWPSGCGSGRWRPSTR